MESKSFSNMLITSFAGVWFGDDHWNGPEWTLSVELWGSFLVYLLVITAYNYTNRYLIYTGVILFFILSQIAEDPDYSQGNKS
jgi:peptidoglycan/LPS O-acetylase OafA/YrhL